VKLTTLSAPMLRISLLLVIVYLIRCRESTSPHLSSRDFNDFALIWFSVYITSIVI